jgi:NTE family protein
MVSPMHAKIGLALSGDGAKGIAHIGVLKLLGESQIPCAHAGGRQHGLDRGCCLRGWSAGGVDLEAGEEVVIRDPI